MNSETRIERIVEEFEEAAYKETGGCNIKHGIAALLRHIASTEDVYCEDDGFLHGVPVDALESLADALTAPTLLDRALSGDKAAAKQFLYEAGFTDASGQLMPHYQSQETNNG